MVEKVVVVAGLPEATPDSSPWDHSSEGIRGSTMSVGGGARLCEGGAGSESCSLVTGGGARRQLIMGWLLGLVEGKGHF